VEGGLLHAVELRQRRHLPVLASQPLPDQIKSEDDEGILFNGVGESAAACRERRRAGVSICSRGICS
jgi:hypothetical protein